MLLGDGKPKGQAGGQCCLWGEFYAAEVNLNTKRRTRVKGKGGYNIACVLLVPCVGKKEDYPPSSSSSSCSVALFSTTNLAFCGLRLCRGMRYLRTSHPAVASSVTCVALGASVNPPANDAIRRRFRKSVPDTRSMQEKTIASI